MLRPSRSSLFVPGNRAAWIEKAAGYGADTLILDLEDSVPDQEKTAARPIVRARIRALAKKGQAASVRVNGFATGLTLDDLEGVVCPELASVTLPKVETPADMHELDATRARPAFRIRRSRRGGTSRTSKASSATRRGTGSSATVARR